MNNIKQFQKELEGLINKYSIENICDVPDFLLAEIITSIIINSGPTIKKVLDWHGCDSVCHPQVDNKALKRNGDKAPPSV